MNQSAEEVKESDKLYSRAPIEEDVPLFDKSYESKKGFNLTEERFNEEKKDKDLNRKLMELLTGWGFNLILICYALILIIHVVDTIVLSSGWIVSGLSESIFELCKSTITMLLGFLFAKSFDFKK